MKLLTLLAAAVLACSPAFSQVYQACPDGRCPTGVCPLPQSRQFQPPQFQQQFQPRVQRQAQARPPARIARYEHGRTYRHARRAVRQQTRRGPVYFNGTSRWTWPGDLRGHMRLHGLDAASADTWSRQQLQQAHSTIHDRSGRGTPDARDVIRFLR